jgi:hypothetical protein
VLESIEAPKVTARVTLGADGTMGVFRVKWRRITGAWMMIIGAAVVVAMAALASLVIANYVEWENGVDAMQTVATLTIPPAICGVIMTFVGRWVYGAWYERSPMLNASGLLIRILGFVVTAIFGSMLVFLLATGITADDQTAAAALGIGTTMGLAIIFLGFRMKTGSGRSYLD